MKMKSFNKTGVILCVVISLILGNCAKADKEFVHDSNTIAKLSCRATHTSTLFEGLITEYDKEGNEVRGIFEQKDVEGGYGIISIKIPEHYSNEIDLHDVYLYATLSWDQSITPSLTGKQDISGEEGLLITVKSGVGTRRMYRIKGYIEQ